MTEQPRPEPQRARSSYLLAGRRVTIVDLFEAGLLAVGDQLTFRRSGETHHAIVVASGKLRLDDGQEFPTPSRAAKAAAGSLAEDGWRTWMVSPGRSLDSLRQRLLEQAAEGASDAPGESSAAGWNSQRRYEWVHTVRKVER